MSRTILRTAAILVAAVLFLTVPVGAISAEKAIVMDAITEKTLYERRADERSLIASTTKIMTALVVCQQCNVLDRVKVPKEAVGVEGSSMYLKEGEVLTVQELLYGLMLHSGNDAAVALAIYCGGTVDGFAQLMNDKARALGMTGSHFVNPNGLDAPEHYSTARDLAILASNAMQDPIFAKTVATKQVKIGERCLTNHNKLLWRIEGADGVKTGYTKAAGRLLVSSAVRQGRRLVCVTINAPDDWNDHAQLLEEGFSRYIPTRVVSQGECLGRMNVMGGAEMDVELVSSVDFDYPLAEDEIPKIVLSPEQFCFAPVVRGAPAGTAYVQLGNTIIGKIPLVFGDTVEQIPEKEKPWWQIFGG